MKKLFFFVVALGLVGCAVDDYTPLSYTDETYSTMILTDGQSLTVTATAPIEIREVSRYRVIAPDGSAVTADRWVLIINDTLWVVK